eukprot:CAMPEP_0196165524 /NCGR_PEP_ID=MMETSP0911-20130528/1372_1 /TAXON_ID=49265 /ORGANISM="Thalassiosira rotula, Strain GSO102" /LENGTH=61 /DNA_ID=CAMNT_0041430973 /DNA_START=493 /DNA_END=675 /DNA_ORIENTATION=+
MAPMATAPAAAAAMSMKKGREPGWRPALEWEVYVVLAPSLPPSLPLPLPLPLPPPLPPPLP